MPNPLLEFYNTVLFIPSASTMGVDSVGNPVLVPGAETAYKVYLKKSTKDPAVGYSVGVDNSKQYFVGYVIEPESLPIGLKLPVTVRCHKRQGRDNKWIEGKFEILPQFLPIYIVETVLGDFLSGYFLIS